MPDRTPDAVISYALDEHDVITAVSGDWSEVEDAVIGRSLWRFVRGTDLQTIYRELIARARAGHTIRFDYRCDSSTHRRWMVMEIGLEGDVEVRVNSRVISTASRDEPLLVRAVTRSPKLLVRCSVCNLFRIDDQGARSWVDLVDAVTARAVLGAERPVKVVYAVCPTCRGSLHALTAKH